MRETAVELVLETRGHEHAQRVLSTLRDEGYRGAGPALMSMRPMLAKAAEGHSDNMVARTYFDHVTVSSEFGAKL